MFPGIRLRSLSCPVRDAATRDPRKGHHGLSGAENSDSPYRSRFALEEGTEKGNRAQGVREAGIEDRLLKGKALRQSFPEILNHRHSMAFGSLTRP